MYYSMVDRLQWMHMQQKAKLPENNSDRRRYRPKIWLSENIPPRNHHIKQKNLLRKWYFWSNMLSSGNSFEGECFRWIKFSDDNTFGCEWHRLHFCREANISMIMLSRGNGYIDFRLPQIRALGRRPIFLCNIAILKRPFHV